MSPHHQNPAPTVQKALGRVDKPGLLYGSIGLALGTAMQLIGLFRHADTRIKQALLEILFHGEAPNIIATPVIIIVAAVFCFGIGFAVLDSAGNWRRIILGITALVIIVAMIPAFGVWHIYFSPFLPVIAVIWTWFCTMMYVNHHTMPCDRSPSANSIQAQKPAAGIELTAPPAVVKKQVKKKTGNRPRHKAKSRPSKKKRRKK